jgi:hypothetical protein
MSTSITASALNFNEDVGTIIFTITRCATCNVGDVAHSSMLSALPLA